jgi:hypothetical protein
MNRHQLSVSGGRSGSRVRLFAAVLGGAAVAAMCVLSTGLGDTGGAMVSSPAMTTGATATDAYSAPPVTSVITPRVKAKYNGGLEP